MMGVDRIESKSKANAAKSSTDRGVAGRNMVIRGHAAKPRGREKLSKKRASAFETRRVEKRRPIVLPVE
jgi:hypothetical protein